MNYEELHRYIRDLQQSGFDVVRLRVQLHKKLSYPLITLIMAILAIPFSLSTGKKGADHRSRGRRRNRSFLHRGVAPVRSHGRPQPAPAGPGGLVAGPDLRPGRWIFDFESANVRSRG